MIFLSTKMYRNVFYEKIYKKTKYLQNKNVKFVYLLLGYYLHIYQNVICHPKDLLEFILS